MKLKLLIAFASVCLVLPLLAHAASASATCTPYTGGYLGNIVCVYDNENGFTGVWVGQGIVIQGIDVHAGSNGLDACVSTQSQCAFWGGPA